MKKTLKAIENINWQLLREQKERLFLDCNSKFFKPEQQEDIEGMLSLLDCIQDAAVADGIATEEEVFGLMPDTAI